MRAREFTENAAAIQAAIAISKKKSGKYNKDGKRIKENLANMKKPGMGEYPALTPPMEEEHGEDVAFMGKLESNGKIVRILRKAHDVQFSDKKGWLLIDTDPAKGARGLGAKWIPADTRFTWVKPFHGEMGEDMGNPRDPKNPGAEISTQTGLKGINQAGDKFVGLGDPRHGFAIGIGKPIGADDVKPTLRYSAPISGGDNTVSTYIAPHRAGINFNIPFENFADGRHPEDKGDSKRYHVPTKGSVTSLRKFAKGHSGRAAQLAHWMANMKSGHKK